MQKEGWKYYNHAMVPTTAPHELPDTRPIENGKIWENRGGNTPLLARWITDFDCGYETNWWYVIKDDPFDITTLKSKRRYEINKGNKNFDVRKINPQKYVDELYEVFIAANESWPEKYRPQFTCDDAARLAQKLSSDPQMTCYGAFYRETGELCGFVQTTTYETYVEFQVQRMKPMYESFRLTRLLYMAYWKIIPKSWRREISIFLMEREASATKQIFRITLKSTSTLEKHTAICIYVIILKSDG